MPESHMTVKESDCSMFKTTKTNKQKKTHLSGEEKEREMKF